ncbi:hypothetical protein [Mesorhizobium sp. M7A.F.Ca.ET.027.03.2.1]|uniref:hypothetical protein n=2 Tax=Mesorhizobium TaxID=68287 RepID=UPI00167B4A1E
MGRADIDAHASPCVLPTLPAFYTGKYERMFAVLVEDGEFEFATKRSAEDRLPHLPMIGGSGKQRLDLNHFPKLPLMPQRASGKPALIAINDIPGGWANSLWDDQ